MEEQQLSDRGRNGRFVPGNKAAKGNPHARRLHLYRNMLHECIDDEESFPQVVRSLVAKAIGGDVAAIKLVLEYTLGKPRQEIDLHASGGIETDTAEKERVLEEFRVMFAGIKIPGEEDDEEPADED